MKFRFTLSIGFVGARREEIVDIDDDELAECETDQDRENLIDEYWNDWSRGHIDGGAEPVEN